VGQFARAEGNYTKDQMNYTRSFYFYYLPFYHTGLRTAYHVNDKLSLNYWVVNGANQSEPTNSYKDELFGYVLQPAKTLTWTTNYYLGQENPMSLLQRIVPFQCSLGCVSRPSSLPEWEVAYL